jgi:hypothetical protein
MLVVVSRAGEAVEVEAALCTVDKGILSVRKEEVVIRSSRDRGGSKGVSGMAARIMDLEEGVHLLVSISGEPSTGGVLFDWQTVAEENRAAIFFVEDDSVDGIEGMDGCKRESAAGALRFVELLKDVREHGAWAVFRARTSPDAGKSKKSKSGYGMF